MAEFIFVLAFVLFMSFLIIGFNRQMRQRTKEKEDRLQKYRDER